MDKSDFLSACSCIMSYPTPTHHRTVTETTYVTKHVTHTREVETIETSVQRSTVSSGVVATTVVDEDATTTAAETAYSTSISTVAIPSQVTVTQLTDEIWTTVNTLTTTTTVDLNYYTTDLYLVSSSETSTSTQIVLATSTLTDDVTTATTVWTTISTTATIDTITSTTLSLEATETCQTNPIMNGQFADGGSFWNWGGTDASSVYFANYGLPNSGSIATCINVYLGDGGNFTISQVMTNPCAGITYSCLYLYELGDFDQGPYGVVFEVMINNMPVSLVTVPDPPGSTVGDPDSNMVAGEANFSFVSTGNDILTVTVSAPYTPIFYGGNSVSLTNFECSV